MEMTGGHHREERNAFFASSARTETRGVVGLQVMKGPKEGGRQPLPRPEEAEEGAEEGLELDAALVKVRHSWWRSGCLMLT
jgi:hypothetical protein